MEPKESKSNWHFRISMGKSLLRLCGCYGFWIYGGNADEPVIQMAAVLFGLAEILGILEEV